jgi:DNA-binding transcriptional MerR regulator
MRIPTGYIRHMLPLERNELCDLVGVRWIYLNKLIERGLYGIEPSHKSGEGKGSRRWFSREDVLGIALVWWLFEAGLRTEVIKRVLRNLDNRDKANANSAAKALGAALQKSGAEYLVIEREVRSAESKEQYPEQRVDLVRRDQIADFLRKSEKESLHVLPVRSLFADLASRLKKYE